MRAQAPPAMPAAGKPLQQSAAFPHGAPDLVRSRSRILRDACLVCLIGAPVDKTRMMLWDEHLPLGSRQMSNAPTPRTRGIQRRFQARLAIGVGASIDGIGEHVVDGSVACVDPANLRALVHLEGKAEPFGPEPKPNAARRACLSEFGKDVANGRHDGLIRVEADLAIAIAP